MKMILNTLAAAALGLGSAGVAEAQSGYSTLCGPTGCYTVPSYPTGSSSAYGHGYTPSYPTPPYGKPICPTPSHNVPVYREDRWDDRFDSRWDDRRNDRFDHRLGDRYHDQYDHDWLDRGRDRLDRFDSHRYLNVSNPGRLWR